MIQGMMGMILKAQNEHDCNDFCRTAFKGRMGRISLFVMPEVQIFDHILK